MEFGGLLGGWQFIAGDGGSLELGRNQWRLDFANDDVAATEFLGVKWQSQFFLDCAFDEHGHAGKPGFNELGGGKQCAIAQSNKSGRTSCFAAREQQWFLQAGVAMTENPRPSMIAELPTNPDNTFAHYAVLVLGWVLTTTVSSWIGYRWGLRSQVAAKRLEVQTAMLPLIEKFIVRANGTDWARLRPDSIEQLLEPTVQLKSLLKGRKRKNLIEAWDIFSRTTGDEFHFPNYGEDGEPENKMRQLFVGRLSALREIVQEI